MIFQLKRYLMEYLEMPDDLGVQYKLAEYMKKHPESIPEVTNFVRDHIALKLVLDPSMQMLPNRMMDILGFGAEGDVFSGNVEAAIRKEEQHRIYRKTVWGRLFVSLAMAASIAVVAGVWVVTGKRAHEAESMRRRTAEVVEVSGEIYANYPGGKKIKVLNVGDDVCVGDVLETGENGCVLLAWGDGAANVTLLADSKLEIQDSTSEGRGKLINGRLVVSVAKRAKGMPFVMATSQALST